MDWKWEGRIGEVGLKTTPKVEESFGKVLIFRK